jgi:hypothetical protein
MAIQYEKDGVQVTPIDFDAIQKGDALSPSQLEEITGKKQGTSAYAFAVMQLSQRIANECASRGKIFTIAIVQQHLRVLTDEEASVYNDKQYRAKWRGMKRNHFNNMAVDASKLSDSQRSKHERNILVQAGLLAAGDKERRRLIVQAHQRTTPGLPSTESGNKGGIAEQKSE